MRKDVIKVWAKNPGEDWKQIEIRNELKAFQEFVGGYIETLMVTLDCVVICNEEGRLRGMPENTRILGRMFVGPVIIAGVIRDEFDDAPECMANWIRTWTGGER